MKTLNLVGKQIRKFRYERGLTQDELADRLQQAGWLVSRSGVSKIEGGSVYVPEFRLYYFAAPHQPVTDAVSAQNPGRK